VEASKILSSNKLTTQQCRQGLVGHHKLKQVLSLEAVQMPQPAHFLVEVETQQIALLVLAQINLEEEASVASHKQVYLVSHQVASEEEEEAKVLSQWASLQDLVKVAKVLVQLIILNLEDQN
jgi:hypothetical protein